MNKKVLSSVVILGLSAASVVAQIYTPGASPLPNGEVGEVYAGQTITFTVPTTATVDGAVVGDAVAAAFPAAAAFTGALAGQSFPLDVISTTLSVAGLPAGVTAACDEPSCLYDAGVSGSITLSGTPTEQGTFTINITSLTSGSADLSDFLSSLPFPIPGIPTTFELPQPAPGAFDESGYTMSVTDPSGIAEQNDAFALSLFPNPTEGIATLTVNSRVSGVANVEVYAITGTLVQRTSQSVVTGVNRLKLDLENVPAGVYMVKTAINGHQALVRVQKG